MPGEGYIPPVVIELLATAKDVTTTLAKTKTELVDFARAVTETHLAATAKEVIDGVAKADTLLRSYTDHTWYAGLGVKINEAQVAATLASLDATIAMAKADLTIRGIGGGGAGIGTDLLAAAGGGREGGGGGGLMSALGFGRGGGVFGLLGGLASMGSVAGLAGFSAEGVLGTAMGVGGSMAGAGIGAGLLGLGAAGTAAVGMGTDMAGIGQAMNDLKQYRTVLNQMKAGTITAAQGQRELNAALAGMPAVARGAIVALSNTVTQFVALFDKLTGPAEKIGAQILQQAVQVGEKFLPTIGKFAAQNMGIMKQSLQPFFSWLQNAGKGGGLGIFTNLEKVFQKNLPTAMHAFEQGFELLAKTITLVSGHLGGFTAKVNNFLTRMNGATFGKWSHFVNDMIGLFHAWWPLLVQVGRTLVDIFRPAVGLGKHLAIAMTTLLKSFDKFLEKGKTKHILGNLFSAHNVELITGFGNALTAALPAIETFLSAFVQIETAFRGGITTSLKLLTDAFTALSNIPGATTVLAWAGALGLITSRLAPALLFLGRLPGRLATAATKFITFGSSVASGIGTAAGAIGRGATAVASFAATVAKQVATASAKFAVMVADWIVGAATFIAQNVAMAASATAAFIAENLATLGIITALAALVAAGIYVATHWKQVWGDIKKWASDAWNFLDTKVLQPIIGFFTGTIPGALHTLEAVWDTAWTHVKSFLSGVWATIITNVSNAINDVVTFFTSLKTKIVGAFKDAGKWLFNIGEHIIHGLLGGLKQAWHDVTGWLGHLAGDIISHKGPPSKDAVLLVENGKLIMRGLATGLKAGYASDVLPALQGMAGQIGGQMLPLGEITKLSNQVKQKATLMARAAGAPNYGPTPAGHLSPAATGLTTPHAYAGRTGGVHITYGDIVVHAPSSTAGAVGHGLKAALEEHDRQLLQRLSAGSVR